MTTITKNVAAHLAGQPEQYLQDVVAHGIHNLSNSFDGPSHAEYSAEFERQARALLAKIDAERFA